jgi:hypothetical protein
VEGKLALVRETGAECEPDLYKALYQSYNFAGVLEILDLANDC